MKHTAQELPAVEPVYGQPEEASVEAAVPPAMVDLVAAEAEESGHQPRHYDERARRAVACMGTEALVHATLEGHMSMAEAIKAKRESGH